MKRYAAFISYRHAPADLAWARWLQRALEGWRTPARLVREGYPKRLGSVFLDETELGLGEDLGTHIKANLAQSDGLVVVCSENTRESMWVPREIAHYRKTEASGPVLALLISGNTASAYPDGLGDALAADVTRTDLASGRVLRRRALLRIVSALLGCSFDELVRRESRRRRRRLALAFGILGAVTMALGALAIVALSQRDRADAALARVTRLYDSLIADLLLADYERVGPATPAGEPSIRAWLDRHAALSDRMGAYQAEVAGLRARGQQAREGQWRFSKPEDRNRHDVLAELLRNYRALTVLPKPASAPRRVVERMSEIASDVGRPMDVATQRAWSKSAAAVRDSAHYGGLSLRPQVGLFPLGTDPVTGLEEFAYLPSGEPPKRAGDRLILGVDSAVVLVLVPAGQYIRGAQRSTPSGRNYDPHAQKIEGPPHRVRITRAFFLAKYETMQSQWRRLSLAKSSPSAWTSGHEFMNGKRVPPLAPVENLSWDTAVGVLRRHGLTLPTAAQWEYACRAGSDLPWSGHSIIEDLDGTMNVADSYVVKMWSGEKVTRDLGDGYPTHSPVGHFASNGFGLHDMHGGVYEWCLDGPAGYKQECPCADEPHDDVVGRALGDREIRGGSWRHDVLDSRAAHRMWHPPAFKHATIGVRIARDLDALE